MPPPAEAENVASISVPPLVPSVMANPRLDANTRRSRKRPRILGKLEPLPGSRSAAMAVPATVPSLAHSS